MIGGVLDHANVGVDPSPVRAAHRSAQPDPNRVPMIDLGSGVVVDLQAVTEGRLGSPASSVKLDPGDVGQHAVSTRTDLITVPDRPPIDAPTAIACAGAPPVR